MRTNEPIAMGSLSALQFMISMT